jgi:DNA invertase Pin-like site-specific DNA recombinase
MDIVEKKINVAHYIRRGRPERAVIYVRGVNEAEQEMKCRMYANDKGYEVTYVTRYIEDVKLCDVLIVANFSRISRKQMEFVKTCKMFKARGIRVESVSGNDVGSMFSAEDICEAFESFEKEFNKK